MRRVIALCAIAAFAACGDNNEVEESKNKNDNNNDVNVKVEPSLVRARVSGRIHDHQLNPLAGVTVIVGGQSALTASTDELGYFFLDGVAVDAKQDLYLSKSGFVPFRKTIDVEGYIKGEEGAQNILIEHDEIFIGSYALVPTTDTYTVHVRGFDASLVGSFTGVLEITPSIITVGDGLGCTGSGSFTVNATGSNGVITFANVPSPKSLWYMHQSRGVAVSYTVALQPIFEGTGTRFGGIAKTFSIADTIEEGFIPVITLPAEHFHSPAVVSANISNFGVVNPGVDGEAAHWNLIAPSGAIQVAFDYPVDPSFVEVALYDQKYDVNHYALLKADVAFETHANGLKITPSAALTNGSMYYMVLRLTSKAYDGFGTIKLDVPFFAGDKTAPLALAFTATAKELAADASHTAGQLEADEPVLFALNQPIGFPGMNATTVQLPVYFDFDINSSTARDLDGEKETNTHKPLCVAVKTEVKPPRYGAQVTNTGYARWFELPAGIPGLVNTTGQTGNTGAMNATVIVAFGDWSKCPNNTGTALPMTIFGEPLTGNVEAKLTNN